MEKIKSRYRAGEHLTESFLDSDSEADHGADPEREDTFRRNRWQDDEDFYNRTEFDDAGFRKRKR